MKKNYIYIFFSLCLPLHSLAVEKAEIEKPLSFKELFYNHKLNVSDKWENYLEIYESVFQKFIGKKANALEIGIQNGGTLQILRRYLLNANVYGIDVCKKACAQKLGKNIQTFCFSATDAKRVEDSFKDIQFDIIIDDGSHFSSEVIEAFRIFFSKLKPGGVYLIEDLHASYWDSHQGGYLKENTSIEFLKRVVDLLNFYHIKDKEFLDKLSDKDRYIVEWLESITFYDSVAVLKKLNKPRTKPYKRFVVGKFDPVCPTINASKASGIYYPNPEIEK